MCAPCLHVNPELRSGKAGTTTRHDSSTTRRDTSIEPTEPDLKSLSTDQLHTLAYAPGQQQSVIRDDSLHLTTMRDLPTLMDIDLKQYLMSQ